MTLQGERRRRDPRQLFKTAGGAARSVPRSSTFTADRRGRCCSAGTTWTTTRTTTRRTSTSPAAGSSCCRSTIAWASATATRSSSPENAGARGASEYLDVLAGAKYLQARPDVDASRIGIWGGSYGGYLTALALGRNSDIFAAGVDIHGVHNWDRQRRGTPNLSAALAGDGITRPICKHAARVVYESSPISAVKTWKSPVLLIHADDDRNVDFHQTVDLKQRLLAKGVAVDELVIPDDIHDFLLWRSWRTVAGATTAYLEKRLLKVSTSAN